MKIYSSLEAVKNISEGIFESFAWTLPNKEEAEKLRKRLLPVAIRYALTDSHKVTVLAVVRHDLKSIAYIVSIEPTHYS